jgi:hypothetical protein
LARVKNLYSAWVRIDETLPWIELKGEYQTRRAAKKAAEEALRDMKIKVVQTPEIRERIKAYATARAVR